MNKVIAGEQHQRYTSEEALALFDSLDAIDTSVMHGAWKGEGYTTGHPLDGVLEAFHWHGKRFESDEEVHPLIFSSRSGRLWSVHPVWAIPLLGLLRSDKVPKWPWLGNVFRASLPVFSTRCGRARLRMTRHRGKLSATMAYDHLPIHDVFRKMDADTVLGIMDLKGLKKPFFFVLRREPAEKIVTPP